MLDIDCGYGSINYRETKKGIYMKYTKLEIEVLESIKLATSESSILNHHTIEYFSGLDVKVIRGVLSSLVKKDAIMIDTGKDKGQIHILDSEYDGFDK